MPVGAERAAQVVDRIRQQIGAVELDLRVGEAGAQLRRIGQQPHRGLVIGHRLGDMPVLEQDLAFELVEIRVVGILGDEAVDQRQRLGEIGTPVKGDGAGVAGGHRRIVGLVLPERHGRRLQEPVELGHHAPVHRGDRRKNRLRRPRRARDVVPDEGDPVLGQRVGLHIRVLAPGLKQLLAGQHVQEFEQAAGGLAGSIEEPDRRMVGARFLVAIEPEQRAFGHLQTACRRHHRRFRIARQHADRSTENLRQQRPVAGLLELSLEPGQVTAGDVADFVGHDSDHLTGMGAPSQQTGGQEQTLAAGDEGVEDVAADQVDRKRRRIELRRPQQWRRIGTDGIFDFRVADQRGAARGLCLGSRDKTG